MTSCFLATREKLETGKNQNSIYQLTMETGEKKTIIESFPHTFSALGLLTVRYDDLYQPPFPLPPLQPAEEPADLQRNVEELDQHFQQRGSLSKTATDNLGMRENLEYLLAGHRCGIIIQNLAEGSQEEKKIIVSPPSSRPYRFNFVGTVLNDPEQNWDQVIVAAHDSYGVIKVSLDELLRTTQNELPIQQGDGHHWIFNRQRNDFPLRAVVRGNTLYFSEGVKVYSAEGPDLVSWEFISHQSAFGDYGQHITALEVDGEKNVYVGTDQGRIFRNGKLWWSSADDRRPIFRIQAVAEGVYFTAKGSPVYFTEGRAKALAAFPFLSRSDFPFTTDGFTGDFQTEEKKDAGKIEFVGRTQSGLCLQTEDLQTKEKSGCSYPLPEGQETRCLLVLGGMNYG